MVAGLALAVEKRWRECTAAQRFKHQLSVQHAERQL
jgi:hypothetical protein